MTSNRTRAHLGAARLAAEVLDLIRGPVLAVADQRVQAAVGDAVVGAARRRAGMVLGHGALRRVPAVLDLGPRPHRGCRKGGGTIAGGAAGRAVLRRAGTPGVPPTHSIGRI